MTFMAQLKVAVKTYSAPGVTSHPAYLKGSQVPAGPGQSSQQLGTNSNCLGED